MMIASHDNFGDKELKLSQKAAQPRHSIHQFLDPAHDLMSKSEN